MTGTTNSHIHLDERGVAWIDDTNIKVIEVAEEKRAHGETPETIVAHHAGTLSLAQVYAALAYYYDHQQAFDAEMDRLLREFEQRRAAALESPGRQRLRTLGRIP